MVSYLYYLLLLFVICYLYYLRVLFTNLKATVSTIVNITMNNNTKNDLYPIKYKNYVNSKRLTPTQAAVIIQRSWKRHRSNKVPRKSFFYWLGF